MENEFTDFLNQNWNDKFKAGVTSSSLHLNSSGNGVPNSTSSPSTSSTTITTAAALSHVALQQYHHQTIRGSSVGSETSVAATIATPSSSNYENIRLAFMQHRQQTQSIAAVAAAAAAAAAQAQHATTNSSLPIQRNPSTTAACPKLIDIHCIKGNNAALPFDCQSKVFLILFASSRFFFSHESTTVFDRVILMFPPHEKWEDAKITWDENTLDFESIDSSVFKILISDNNHTFQLTVQYPHQPLLRQRRLHHHRLRYIMRFLPVIRIKKPPIPFEVYNCRAYCFLLFVCLFVFLSHRQWIYKYWWFMSYDSIYFCWRKNEFCFFFFSSSNDSLIDFFFGANILRKQSRNNRLLRKLSFIMQSFFSIPYFQHIFVCVHVAMGGYCTAFRFNITTWLHFTFYSKEHLNGCTAMHYCYLFWMPSELSVCNP